MKKKNILIEIIVISSILLVILILFSNIEKFMPSYRGRVMSYPNKYFTSQEKENPMDLVEKAVIGRELTKEEVELFNNKVIIELYNKRIEQYLQEAKKSITTELLRYSTKYAVGETKYGDIIFQKQEFYDRKRNYHHTEVILFTKDQNSIYYYQRTNLKNTVDVEQVVEIDKDNVIAELQSFIESLELPLIKFKPTVIRRSNSEYVFSDEQQNLEIVYDAANVEIMEFRLNF